MAKIHLVRGVFEMKRAFRIHFNRINMQRGNPNVWTVHTSGKCIQTRHVQCQVPLKSVFNPDGRQPRAFMKGVGEVDVHKKWVIIR